MTALTDLDNVLMVLLDEDGRPVDPASLEPDDGPEDAVTAAGDPTDGAMIALIPSEADLDRLALDGAAVPGALPRDELHLTLLFLGENGAIDQPTRQAIITAVRSMVTSRGYGPIDAEAFAPAMFNPNGAEPCWVLIVGRTDEIGVAREAIGEVFEGNALGFMPPEQHTPNIPHVTLAYDSDPARLTDAISRTGPLTFDRLRVAFGGEVTDIPLGSVTAAAGQPPGGDPAVPWHIEPDHADCPADRPYAVVKDADGTVEGCHPTEAAAQEQMAALYASETGAEGEGDQAAAGEHFHSVMIVEGVSTGRRVFADNAVTWRNPPFALRWQEREPEMGGHALSVHVGNVTRVERRGPEIHAWGPLDLRSPDGLEFARKLTEGFAPWVSIGPDESFRESDIEYVFPEAPEDSGDVEDPPADDPEIEEGDIIEMPLGEPEQEIFHAFRIAELTAVTVPAQAEAFIEPLPALRQALADLGVIEPEATPEALAAAGPATPPAGWFTDPILDGPTPITVTDDGRIYGHAALHGTCHIGFSGGECVTPPAEDEFSHYLTGELATADGTTVPVGQITLGTGHAPLHLAARPAAEHYDNTGTAVADVHVGTDPHGIWVAGAIRPGTDPGRVAELRAAGQVSGDWRRIGGKLRLVGLLAVNVPGFPVPKMRARVASGMPCALVAASPVPPLPPAGTGRGARRAAADRIARTIRRDPASRREELSARVHGS